MHSKRSRIEKIIYPLLNGIAKIKQIDSAIIKSVAGLSVVTVMIAAFSGFKFASALAVSVDGENIAYVSSEEVFNEAMAMYGSQVITLGSEPKVSAECSPVIAPAGSVQNAEQVFDSLVQISDNVVSACGVYINGRLTAYADSREYANSVLSGIISGYAVENGDEPTSFFNNIELRDELYSDMKLKTILPVDKIADIEAYTIIKYQVQKGDTLESIAEKFNSTVPIIEVSNSDSSLYDGKVLTVVGMFPVLCVMTEGYETTENTVINRTSDGKSGTETVKWKCSYIHGIRYSRTEQERSFEEDSNLSRMKMVGSKGFCWPIDRNYKNYVSAYWGDGRGHGGVDIACSTGTPIIAAASGKVVSVNSSGSDYGLHFVIDHGNGIRTLYAHCSRLYVSYGQTVRQGDLIALVGTTGRVTGSHLHFEVLRNGGKVNPASYLGL